MIGDGAADDAAADDDDLGRGRQVHVALIGHVLEGGVGRLKRREILGGIGAES